MAGRASGARCNVHGAMVVMGGGGGGRGAQEQQDEGRNGGGEQTMGVNLVLSCLSAPAPKPEPRAVIPVVKQVLEFLETLDVVSRVASPEETLGSVE